MSLIEFNSRLERGHAGVLRDCTPCLNCDSPRCTAFACSIACIRALQRHVRRATESQKAESVGLVVRKSSSLLQEVLATSMPRYM